MKLHTAALENAVALRLAWLSELPRLRKRGAKFTRDPALLLIYFADSQIRHWLTRRLADPNLLPQEGQQQELTLAGR